MSSRSGFYREIVYIVILNPFIFQLHSTHSDMAFWVVYEPAFNLFTSPACALSDRHTNKPLTAESVP